MDKRDAERERREAPRALRSRPAVDRGPRLRVLGLIAVAVAIVGAGVYGRLDARRDATAAVPTVAPVTSVAVAATASPDQSGGEDAMRRPRLAAAPAAAAGGAGMTLGEDGLIGGAVPGMAATTIGVGAGSSAVCAVLRIKPDITVIGRIMPGLNGAYQGSIRIRAPRRTVTATLELYPAQSASAFQGRSKTAQARIARFDVRVDARPFPPGRLRVLIGDIAPQAGAPTSLPFARTGARIVGTLVSDGHTVHLSVVITPLRGLGGRQGGTVEVHAAVAAVAAMVC